MPRLTEHELATRDQGLGATDVVEALGLAPWEGAGPMRLYLEKVMGVRAEPDAPTQAAYDWGHELEALMGDWYSRETGRALLPGGHVPHRGRPWLWATLDYKAPDRIVECKDVSSFMARHWDPSSEDGVPRYVRVQCLVGQACLGTQLTDVVASLAGRPPHVWTVAWDQSLWDIVIAKATHFWDRCVARRPPELDDTDATRELLRRLYPTNEDRSLVDADLDAEDEARQLIGASMTRRASESAVSILTSKLLKRVGEHDGIRGDGWKLTWKCDKNGTRRSRFTADALKEREHT